MQNSKTPYNNRDEIFFWRSAVASIKLGQQTFDKLTRIRLHTENPKISSVGSCFAQHVGRWLTKQGYSFHQSTIETSQVSSFAFGNIYTPRCFLQWFDIIDENKGFDAECAIHFEKNRYYDLLRPSIYPNGFDRKEDLVEARVLAAKEMYQTLKNTDLLIFTLGLTESWKDQNNVFYPSCPGVISGEFNETKYLFHNFTHDEICSDLQQLKSRLTSINPKINIILTVSPVPLTATMTNKHILVANQHSKSLLRTAASFMCDNYDNFEYFPSFELITAPSDNDFRFETNRRTVTPEAVNYVMGHFGSVLQRAEGHISNANLNQEFSGVTQKITDTEEVECDEEFLESAKKLTEHSLDEPRIDLTLFGDSHMGKLSTAFDNINMTHCGGMVMNGSGFSQKKFALCDTEYFVPLENAMSRKLWSVIFSNLSRHEQQSPPLTSTIITNLGLQTHQNVSRFTTWLQNSYPQGIAEITLKEFVDYFYDDLTEQLSIILKLHENGHKVVVVSDPPFSQYFEESKGMKNIIYAYFNAMEYIWTELGITFFNAARAFDEEITDPENYLSTVKYADNQHDWIHGNEKYYAWLADKLSSLIKQETEA